MLSDKICFKNNWPLEQSAVNSCPVLIFHILINVEYSKDLGLKFGLLTLKLLKVANVIWLPYGVNFTLILWLVWDHWLRTPNEAFFYWNPELLGLGRQFWQVNIGAFGVFSAGLLAPNLVLVPCPCFTLINHYFYKKLSLYIQNPKYLFGIGIWIWAIMCP